MNDEIKAPKHYECPDGSQVIDHMQSLLSPSEFEGFCIGNAMKYITRYKGKGGAQSLRKAQQNIQFAINVLEGRGPLEDG